MLLSAISVKRDVKWPRRNIFERDLNVIVYCDTILKGKEEEESFVASEELYRPLGVRGCVPEWV